MSGMPRSAPSALIPDLFDHVPAAPQRSRRSLPKVGAPGAPASELSNLPDARLARLLVEVARELQHRSGGRAGWQGRPELDQAIREAARVLEALMPKRAGKARRPGAADHGPTLQEAKRKAIRTALLAGVSPGQVAKHFGLSLAAVRKVLADESGIRGADQHT